MRLGLIVCAALIISSGCNSAPPQVLDQFVHCRSLDGERTAIKILEWKFDAVSEELAAVCSPGTAMSFDEITQQTLKQMPAELRESLGEPAECVELTLKELEVRGVFVRSADAEALTLTRVI